MSLNTKGLISLIVFITGVMNCAAQSSGLDDLPPIADPAIVRPAEPIIPAVPIIPSRDTSTPVKEPTGVDWSALLRESFAFLTLEHGFRYMTENGTRHPHSGFVKGYVDSLNNLHGWGDGDPFLVNWVGHPMQGAVAGFLFAQNDRKYRFVEFGKNRWYWKSRLRATAYSWAYSEQFEIGPLSEAALGTPRRPFRSRDLWTT